MFISFIYCKHQGNGLGLRDSIKYLQNVWILSRDVESMSFEIPSGSETFKCQIITSGLATDASIMIRVGHTTGALETLVMAYPSVEATATTLLNSRPDDLELTARKLASRLASKYKRPVMLSLEIPSQQETPPELWAKHISNIELGIVSQLSHKPV
jgi:hypothetical protein